MHGKADRKKVGKISPGNRVALIRKALGHSQPEFALLIGCAPSTLQRIELASLRLSERLAFGIERKIGINARWLLSTNQNDPLPSGAVIRAKFEAAQAKPLGDTYLNYQMARAYLLKIYYLGREVANELESFDACRASGLIDVLLKAQLAILNCLPPKARRRFQKASVEGKNPDDPFAALLEMCRIIAGDVSNLRNKLLEVRKEEEGIQNGHDIDTHNHAGRNHTFANVPGNALQSYEKQG